MVQKKRPAIYASNDPAIMLQNNRQPDRRQISGRWLFGTFLTGITSSALMGIALFAALDGREQLATPPEVLARGDLIHNNFYSNDIKVSRIITAEPRRILDNKQRLELSTMQKINGKEVIQNQAFELIDMPLATEHFEKLSYPKFNALNLFSDIPIHQESPAQIYGPQISTEFSFRFSEFLPDTLTFDDEGNFNLDEIEHNVSLTAQNLKQGELKITPLHYVDPLQLAAYNPSPDFSDSMDVKIVQENVSVLPGFDNDDSAKKYAEDIIPLTNKETFIEAFHRLHYKGRDIEKISEMLTSLMGSTEPKNKDLLRVGMETNSSGEDHMIRASLYRDKEHILTVALNDLNQYVKSDEPEMSPFFQAALEGKAPIAPIIANRLPTVYDAIFRSALSYDMTADMAKQLVRMLAHDIDMQSRVSPKDSLEVFFPSPDDRQEHDILYVNAKFSGIERRYYRFQSANGKIDYYNEDGRSSKLFLLRKPVPQGIFRSPFGPRRHPVLGYVRIHSGVDWTAPRGSPIIAAGDGEIIYARRSRGYGNQIVIQHSNGYQTRYAHQHAFAKGIKEGMKVNQGQVIGYVGSSGLSTGPHCHFEVIVNETKVDPMRVRLPDSKSLKGTELASFKRARNQIDALMKESTSNTKLASSNKSRNDG